MSNVGTISLKPFIKRYRCRYRSLRQWPHATRPRQGVAYFSTNGYSLARTEHRSSAASVRASPSAARSPPEGTSLIACPQGLTGHSAPAHTRTESCSAAARRASIGVACACATATTATDPQQRRRHRTARQAAPRWQRSTRTQSTRSNPRGQWLMPSSAIAYSIACRDGSRPGRGGAVAASAAMLSTPQRR